MGVFAYASARGEGSVILKLRLPPEVILGEVGVFDYAQEASICPAGGA